MKNYIAPGDSITAIAPSGGVVSGVPVVIGSLFLIPKQTAAQDSEFVGMRKGIFELPKGSAATPAFGAKAYWDDAGEITATATDNLLVGVFAATGIATETAVNVLLTGQVV